MRRLLLFGACAFCVVGASAAGAAAGMAGAAGTAPAVAGAASSETIKRLEGQWRKFDPPQPNLGVRDLFSFALEATAIGWQPERVERALDLAEQMQDRDEASPTYGNFRWYWRTPKPIDRNAVEFSMQQATLLWMLHREGLTPAAAERLERLLTFSVEGIRRHRVAESYTNIFLMKTWNCVAIGEATGRSDLADEGYQMLDRWLTYTWECGIHEYLSPTYYGTDLSSLGLLAKFAKREEGRRSVEAALRLFWTDIAANWHAGGQRLGGAHSRDYDYLTGHGALDPYLEMAGWIGSGKPQARTRFLELTAWTPPAELRQSLAAQTPRIVVQKWGPQAANTATQYVGKRFSIGSAGSRYGSMDKPLTVDLADRPDMPVVNFFMDARGDAYGKAKFELADGHSKALHLQPFYASVQRGPEVLFLASMDMADPTVARDAPNPTCLLSQIAMPTSAALWIGEGAEAPFEPGPRAMGLAAGEPVFLRFGDVAVGLRVVLALDTAGKEAAAELCGDGAQFGAMRLTVIHSKTKPQGRATVAVWARGAEGLDDAGFAAFRRAFCAAEPSVNVEGDSIDIAVPGLAGRLRVAADVKNRNAFAREGMEPGTGKFLLAVNGRDLGREILQDVGPVGRYRKLLEEAEKGGAAAMEPDRIFEAENAALVFPPFKIGEDAGASGGKFVWVPGEEGGKGGDPNSRAVYFAHVPKAGAYYLWARVLAPTPSDDSFYVAVSQSEREALPKTDWQTQTHKTWEWAQVCPGKPEAGARPAALKVELEAGRATIEFYCREDGTKLDALFLTADPDARPPEPATK